MIIYFQYSLKYNQAIRHNDENTQKQNGRKSAKRISFDKFGLWPLRKSKDLAANKLGVQLDPILQILTRVGADMRCSSVVDEIIANTIDFRTVLPLYPALLKFKLRDSRGRMTALVDKM